jgi:hypothetical protein
LGESLVHDQDIRNHEQVDTGGQDLRFASTLLSDFGGLGRPGDATSQAIPALLQIPKKEISCRESILAENQVQTVGVRRLIQI